MSFCVFRKLMPRLVVIACWISVTGCGDRETGASPTETLHEAWADFQLREFDSAWKGFVSVQKATPAADPRHTEAIYGEASCWNLRREDRNPVQARRLYQKIVAENPENVFAPWAALDWVRSFHLFAGVAAPDEVFLINEYAKVEREFPGTPAAAEAFLFRSNLRVLKAQVPEELARVAADLIAFAEANPQSPYLQQVYVELQRVHRLLGEPDKRLAAAFRVLELTEEDPINPHFDVSYNYWTIAQIAQFDVGDFTTARAYYKKFLNDYPNDQRVFTIHHLLEEMDRIEAADAVP